MTPQGHKDVYIPNINRQPSGGGHAGLPVCIMRKKIKEEFMKTAKRIMCSALVLVLALSLISFASADTTADYSDGDKVKYTEAVDVLTGIRVIEGTDGAFRPEDPVTRAESAAILTRLLLTRDTADNLPVSNTGFSDVAADHWAAKYVAYCSSQGIILGRPDGNFYPNDPVTAAEFVIMLMRALDIGDPDRYVGSTWNLNAILDGMDSGLLNTNVNYTAPATREEIAQYAFNGLIYSSTGSAEKIWGVISYKTDADGFVEFEYGWITIPGSAPDSLISKRYPSLESTIDDTDDLGRPATTWKFQKAAISTYITQPIATFNAALSQDDVFKVTGLGSDITKTAVSIDAVVNQAGAQDAKAEITSLRNSNIASNSTIYGSNGNGIITEIYRVKNSDTPDAFKAVIIKPSFAEVDIKPTSATPTVGAYNTYSFNTKDSGTVYTSHVDPDFEKDNVIISGKVTKGDRALYYWGKDNLYIEAVRTITGTINSISSAGVIVFESGTTYKAGAFAGSDIYPSKDEGVYFIDSFGFILGVKESGDSNLRVALVIATDSYSILEDNKVIPKYFVIMADINGKVTTVPASQDYKDTLNGLLCTYTTNIRTEEYDFDVIAPNIDTDVGSYKVRTGDIVRIEKANPEMTAASSHFVNLAGNTTKFYIVNSDNTITTVTGISNISSMLSLSKTTSVSLSADGTAPNAVADVVFIYDGNKSAAETEYVFYLGTYQRLADGITIDVHISGVPSSIPNIAEGPTGIDMLTSCQLYQSVSVSTSGAVTATPITSADASLKGAGVLQYDGGMLFFKGSYTDIVDQDTPTYIITLTDGVRSVESGVAKDIKVTLRTAGYVYVVKNLTGEALAIYIFDFV